MFGLGSSLLIIIFRVWKCLTGEFNIYIPNRLRNAMRLSYFDNAPDVCSAIFVYNCRNPTFVFRHNTAVLCRPRLGVLGTLAVELFQP